MCLMCYYCNVNILTLKISEWGRFSLKNFIKQEYNNKETYYFYAIAWEKFNAYLKFYVKLGFHNL